jgi:hypothetical protein
VLSNTELLADDEVRASRRFALVGWAALLMKTFKVIAHLEQELAPMALYLATFMALKG